MLKVVGNSEARTLDNEEVHMVKDEALTNIEGPGKLRGVFRYISEIPKSDEAREITGRHAVWEEWNNNAGAKLIDDYDICGKL